MTGHGLLDSARRIARLAWPVFIGQLAVLAFSTADTVMVARHTALDLAALAIGGATYITIFVGLMGVVLAIGPIAGQLFGARDLPGAGRQFQQSVWLALLLSVPGCALLLMPQPFLALAQASPEVAERVRGYLGALAFALPPALVFTAFRGFNTAVSRPTVVMLLQLGALALKLPLNAALIFGTTFGPLQIPALGAAGCGVATAIVMWLQLALAWQVLRRDSFYAAFGLRGHPFPKPDRASIVALLRLGVPMGGSILIEVTGFTFMAFFISRIGSTAVAGHQLAANLVSLMFMLPLALANASGTLVAQSIGAHDAADARRIGWHGLLIGVSLSAVLGAAVYLSREAVLGAYTSNATIIAAAMPLLAWVAVFHIADSVQTIASFVLRAYRLATVPMLIYAFAIWGIGLGGGYAVAFDTTGHTPAALHGALGFWSACTAGLVAAAAGLSGFLVWLWRQKTVA